TIADEAFERVFDCFGAYCWRLDDGSPRGDDLVTPDVFDQTFAQHVTQKQTGAYYTGADVAEYVVANTVIPALWGAGAAAGPGALARGGAGWGLLREQRDRYVPEGGRQGIDEPLPAEIATGLADVSCRAGWDRPAAEPFGLPTETWREHVARRAR